MTTDEPERSLVPVVLLGLAIVAGGFLLALANALIYHY